MTPPKASLVALGLFLSSPLHAMEFFVNKEGLDSNAGTSREAAFLTVQKGVNALEPGDTLTVGRGEYAEAVARKGLGSEEKQTVIRGEISGTVLLRGDVDAPVFRPVAGLRQTCVAEFKGSVQAVYEVDTWSRLGECASLADVEFQPGSYFYDAAAGRLYVASTDLRPVAQHHYSVPVIGRAGLELEQPVRVALEGIAVRGFESNGMASSRTLFGTWGILLLGARDCVVSDCTAFLNGGGICIASEGGGGNLVERCAGYGNSSPHNASECAGVLLYQSKNDVARNCVGYRSIGVGVRIYGAGAEHGLLDRCLGWGNAGPDVGIKSGRAETCEARNSVGLRYFPVRNVSHSILGGPNIYVPDEKITADNIRLQTERVKSDQEFADPVNFDFRLQATSAMRGAAPEGRDRGPFPYLANVFFVKPTGEDTADGLSLSAAWKTLARAVEKARPGDTVYLEQGVYDGGVRVRAGEAGAASVAWRARGAGVVTLTGDVHIENSAGIEFERLHFLGAVTASASTGVRFHNCRFAGGNTGLSARRVSALKVTHCEFTGFGAAALVLDECASAHLSSNVYDNRTAPAVEIRGGTPRDHAVRYSDYHGYADPARAWKVGDGELSLAQLQPTQDTYSHPILPVFGGREGGATLADPTAFLGRGALGQSVGFHQDRLSNTLEMTTPVVHSVGTTTANIEWLVTHGAVCELAWGETLECANRVKFHVGVSTDDHRTFSLTGLQPGKTYHFRIVALSAANPFDGKGKPEVLHPQYGVLSFTTDREQPAAKTYYVATDGDDANSGLERGRAWRTVGHAASSVRAGDTILIAGGTYFEKVRVRVSGDKGLPIRFQSIPGEKVIFDGNQRRSDAAWVINGKANIQLDGVYFRQIGLQGAGNSGSRAVNVSHSTDVSIRRCLWDGYGKGYAPGFVCAWYSENLRISNCVIARGFDGLEITSCPGFLLENNVFVCNLIQTTKLATKATVRNNIFADSIPSKVKVPLQQYGAQHGIEDRNNCYFLRVPDEERQLFWVLNFAEGAEKPRHTRMSLAEYDRRVKVTGSILADPRFPAVQRLAPAKVAPFPVDSLAGFLDFPDVFATNPEVVNRGMGLQPEAFADMLRK
jgi:parallel beta-helix repeat protein